VRSQVQQLVWKNLGLVRSGEGLEETLRAFDALRALVVNRLRVTGRTRVINREWMEAIELENMLDVGQAMAAAALARTETRGAHYRQDYPEQDDVGWRANLYVRRDRGRPHVERRPLAAPASSSPRAHRRTGEGV